jgi:hypothetical protein
LKLKYDEPLSDFVFEHNLRRYAVAAADADAVAAAAARGTDSAKLVADVVAEGAVATTVGPGRCINLNLSVGVTTHAYLLEIEGLFTQGSRSGRILGESVGGSLEMDSSDWSNGIRYHIFDTRPDTESKSAC